MGLKQAGQQQNAAENSRQQQRIAENSSEQQKTAEKWTNMQKAGIRDKVLPQRKPTESTSSPMTPMGHERRKPTHLVLTDDCGPTLSRPSMGGFGEGTCGCDSKDFAKARQW